MIFLILTVATILRLITLNQSLWLDEAINVNNAANLSFKSLVLSYSLGDFHPPLYHLILRAWILLFGQSEISVRLPSVILGVFTVWITYLLAKKLFEKKTAFVAATLLATAPLHIYYSQEARMYMLAAAFTSLSVYFFISVLKKDTIISWVGFIASTTLMLYSDYLPYLMIPIYALFLIFNKKKIAKETLKSFLPAVLLVFVLLIPWLIVFPRQLSVGLASAAASPAWAQVVGAAELKNLAITPVKFTIGRISYDDNLIYALLFAPAACFVTLLFIFSFFRMSTQRFFLWFWFFLPTFFSFVISYFIPIFAYFRLIFVLPAFYLIWATSINTLNWIFLTRLLLTLALALNLTSTIIYFTNSRFQREDWRMASAYIHQNSSKNSVVLFESNYPVAPFDYYNKDKITAYGALDSYYANQISVEKNLAKYTQDKDKVFLFQYLSPITDPSGLVFQELTQLGFANTATHDFRGVGFVYEFVR